MEKIHVGPTCTIYKESDAVKKELKDLTTGSFFLHENHLYRKVRVKGERCRYAAYMNSYGTVDNHLQGDLLVIPVKVEIKIMRKKHE